MRCVGVMPVARCCRTWAHICDSVGRESTAKNCGGGGGGCCWFDIMYYCTTILIKCFLSLVVKGTELQFVYVLGIHHHVCLSSAVCLLPNKATVFVHWK
mmetsp:Transcript_1360/g.2463  ORF Transcript_1360/g.2463 Transcript_1360/m.2463 type:complete len:99 (-) Transcript_1360:543-839(-)